MIIRNEKNLVSKLHSDRAIVKKYHGGRLVWEKQSGDLPAGYTRCKYLESNGHQYINTLIAPTLFHKLQTTIKYTSVEDTPQWMGYVAGGNAGWFAVGKYGSGIGMVAAFRVDSRKSAMSIPNDMDWHEYTIANGIERIDSTEKVSYVDKFRQILSDAYIFGGNNNYGQIIRSSAKVSDWKITYRDEAIMNCVPSIDPSGKPCMYDIVSKQPFYNSGNGEFGYELEDGTYVAPI